MGVTGLWKLIEPCGQPIPVEMLESKVLAIDISIWLHQVVKGFQDNRGSALANAHLLGLFHRLCKLMYYRIKPIFVFDGKVPTLKKETIAKRNQKRSKLNDEADRIQTLLLQSLAKEKVVQQALGSKAAAELLKISPSKNKSNSKRPDIDDIFKLPDLPPIKENSEESDFNTTAETTCSSETDSSFDESKPRRQYDQNLQAIDVKSEYFRNLPAEIRHEILIDIKETRKQSSWGKLHELPSKSNDFSSFQMKRLLKRRQVQESLEEAEKEMDGARTFTLSELEDIFSEEGIIQPSALPNTKQISSDANTRFLLVRDLKKTLQAAAIKSEELDVKPETSTQAKTRANLMKEEPKPDLCEELKKEQISDLGGEYDEDLQRALQMSLEESSIYKESDYQHEGVLKLNKEQRKHLKNTAVGLARAYMIEHAGMNDDDLQTLLEQTQVCSDDEEFGLNNDNDHTENGTQFIQEEKKAEIALEEVKTPPIPASESKLDLNKAENLEPQIVELNSVNNPIISQEYKLKENCNKSQAIQKQNDAEEVGIITDTSSDSELEEVCESSFAKKLNTNEDKSNMQSSSNLEIFIDASQNVNQDDDLFADVFSSTVENKTEPKPTSSNVTEILLDLKKQASEVTKINLTDIKLDPSIIDISDEEIVYKNQNVINETVSEALNQSQSSLKKDIVIAQSTSSEISGGQNKTEPKQQIVVCEDIHENQCSEETRLDIANIPLNSKKQPETCEIIEIDEDSVSTKKSPTQRTPSKTKSISEFFETKYIIKRTPEKPPENTENIPNVKSPFFIKRTPKSSSSGKSQGKRNATDDECSPAKKSSKAAKMLFEKSSDNSNELELIKLETEEPNTLQMAANVLMESKTRDELEDLASHLAKENKDLEKERNRQDRMGMTITERMNSECMQLLRLFGVPFIVAPMEAEAQCAFLDAMQLTNGTITDDSDIWLFGGRTVYKNFFAQNKHVLEFKSNKIENAFNIDRKKLIQLALLVGSDYTTGINGIGAVTALEILACFSVNEAENTLTNQQTATVLSTLQNFRNWWLNAKSNITIGNSTRHKLRNKLKNIDIYEGFPNPAVVEAYLTPVVDNSQETLSWGTPDVESIKEFTRTNFGWTRIKTDEILGPVLKKINEKKSQSTIKNYFSVKSVISSKEMPVSKRVQNAINKMSADYKSDEEKVAATSPKKPKRKKRSTTTAPLNVNEGNEATKPKRGKRKQTANLTSGNEVTEVIPNKTSRTNRKDVKMPTSVEIIPQRQKDIEEMERNKKLAAEVLKKTKSATSKK